MIIFLSKLAESCFLLVSPFYQCFIVWFLFRLSIIYRHHRGNFGFEWETARQHNQRWHVQIWQA